MFGLSLGSLFSSSSAEKVVDGVYNGIDKAFYTDEERADQELKKAEIKLKFLPLFEPYKLAQRYIAVMFTINFIMAFWVGVFLLLYSTEKVLLSYLKLIGTFELGYIMIAIIVWYFTNGTGLFKKKGDT